MKILLIAPAHPNLPSIGAEIAAISSFHDVRRVIGTVREFDIQEALKGQVYDIIWFATHGGPEGVLLSNVTLPANGIGQYVGASAARLCVLNTCASEEIAFQIMAGGNADMVCTISEDIQDGDALRFGALFAGKLATELGFEEAFNIAAGPASTKYRYLHAKVQYLRIMQPEIEKLSEGAQQAHDDRVRIQLMIAILYIIVVLGGVGLYREILTIQSRQSQIISDIHEMEQRLIQLQLSHELMPGYPYFPPAK